MINVRWFVKVLTWGIMLSVAWLTLSCDEFCEEMNRTAIVVSFYSGKDVLTPVNGLTITTIGNDSVLYKTVNISQALLPVNPVADSMSFILKKGEEPADTLIIRYIRHNGFISPECGCATYAEIKEETEITGNTFTDMVIVNPNATTVTYRQGVKNAENIKIYH